MRVVTHPGDVTIRHFPVPLMHTVPLICGRFSPGWDNTNCTQKSQLKTHALQKYWNSRINYTYFMVSTSGYVKEHKTKHFRSRKKSRGLSTRQQWQRKRCGWAPSYLPQVISCTHKLLFKATSLTPGRNVSPSFYLRPDAHTKECRRARRLLGYLSNRKLLRQVLWKCSDNDVKVSTKKYIMQTQALKTQNKASLLKQVCALSHLYCLVCLAPSHNRCSFPLMKCSCAGQENRIY